MGCFSSCLKNQLTCLSAPLRDSFAVEIGLHFWWVVAPKLDTRNEQAPENTEALCPPPVDMTPWRFSRACSFSLIVCGFLYLLFSPIGLAGTGGEDGGSAFLALVAVLLALNVSYGGGRPIARAVVIASVKEQLDKIICDLKASIGRDAARSTNASETGGGTPGYAIIGTGMMGRERIRAILQQTGASSEFSIKTPEA